MQREDSMVKELKKRLTALILVAGLLLGNLAGHGIVVFAAEEIGGTVGPIRWDLDSEGNLLFRGSLKFPLLEPDKIPWREYASRIKSVTFQVSSIQDGDLTNYFYNCVNLQSVGDIPEGVRNLTQTFQDCRSLRAVGKIPESVETMERTFENCTSLNQTITIPKKVKNLKGVFKGCTALSRLPEIETTLAKEYSQVMQGTAITKPIPIPKGVTDVTGMFSGCKKMTEPPALPEGITEAERCFYECEALTKAPTLPETIENIREMFYGCINLKNAADIPTSVKNMSGCYAKCVRASGTCTIYAVINEVAAYTKFAAVTAVSNSSENGEFFGAAGTGMTVNYIAGNAHLIRRYLATGWNCGNLETTGVWGKLKVGQKIVQSVEDCNVSQLPAATYTGKAICPTVKVYYGNVLLKEKADYTVEYSNNINAGTATVVISGMGDYSGKKQLTFTIQKAALSGVSAKSYQGVYDEKTHGITLQTPAGVTVRYGTKAGEYPLTTAPQYSLPGKYTVYYQVSRANYTTVTGSADVTIVQGTMPVVSESYNGIYDGKEHAIRVAGVEGAEIRYGTTEGKYTAVECPKFKDAGTYNVYYQVTKTGYGQVIGMQQVVIKKKPIVNVTFPTTSEVEYGTPLSDIPTSEMQDSYGIFTWSNPAYVPSVDDVKSEMCYEPFDKKNYDYTEVQGYDSKSGNIVRDVVLSVRRKKGKLPNISAGFLAEGDELERSELLSDHLELGDFFWAKPEEKVTQNKSEYTMIFRPKDLRNYDWSELSQYELDWNLYQIPQKVEVVPYPEPIEIVYGDTLGSKPFMGKNPDVTYRWQDETIAPEKTGLQKLKMFYQGQEIEREMEVVVLKRKPNYVIPVLEPISYDPAKKLKDIKLPEHWFWSEPESTLSEGTGYYEAYYEPEDTEHYLTVYEKIPLQVEKIVPTAAPAQSALPNPTEVPAQSATPKPTAAPGQNSTSKPTTAPGQNSASKPTTAPGQSSASKPTAAPKQTAKPKSTTMPASSKKQEEVVISIAGADKAGKNQTLFGVKKQQKIPGKVRFKKIRYANRKIRLTWKKGKQIKGYQVVFMKKKKGKTRMVKITKKTKLSLAWNGVGKCYVKIRAFQTQGKKRIYGAWSACKQVKSC